MKITVLTENTACRQNVSPQHGLSLWIETGDHRILFDMGQDDTFFQNAGKLGIDIREADIAVLSHGHYDHGGGLETFLRSNTGASIYVHEQAFGEYYNGTEKYIGLDQSLIPNTRLIMTGGTQKLSDNLLLTDCNDLTWACNSWGLKRKEGEKLSADSFLHEQYLEITEGGKRILISGCSHKGIVNIAGYFRPDVLIGGFHLNKLEDGNELKTIAEALLSGDTIYYTGHCTGEKQFAQLKEIMGDRLHRLSTGVTFEI